MHYGGEIKRYEEGINKPGSSARVQGRVGVVVQVGAVWVGRRRGPGGRVGRHNCKQGERRVEENEKRFKEMFRKSHNQI